MDNDYKSSRVIPGRYPPPGESAIADAIRGRRGARGLTPLDGALLHVPPIAEGWNTLLGAVRTKGKLPGDVREIMILRVAAINGAAFEWMQHEPVGRTHGLTTGQLYVVRDIDTPLPPSDGIMSSLQMSALLFADTSTRGIKVPGELIQTFKQTLAAWIRSSDKDAKDDEISSKVDDLYAEAALVTASYNMVSRFLVATDVAGLSDEQVAWPVDRKEHFVKIPSPGHTIHAVTLITSPDAPWIVFANSLLTDLSMWSYFIPYLLSSPFGKSYNILLHSQRGHGKSTLPNSTPQTTIPALATDIRELLSELSISTPVHTVIGVSQGGAAALAFAALYGAQGASSIVVCDTGAKTPEGNKAAWEERITLVAAENQSAEGMKVLGRVTIPRWFPAASRVVARGRSEWIHGMIEGTPVEGFEAGARALGDYDLFSFSINGGQTEQLLESDIGQVLLVAGELDGGGKVGAGLMALGERWNAVRGEKKQVTYASIPGAGHLPMIDETEKFWEVVGKWL
ncbi:Alpha/Beta hydrolase protein, partial [Crucibulum laeve]